MHKELVDSGQVHLTNANDQYYLMYDDTPTIKQGETVVTFDGCNSGCFDDRTLYCTVEDIQPLQAFLRSATRRRMSAPQSFNVTAASAGASGRSCLVCEEAFTGSRRADGSVYYLKQDSRNHNFRTAAFHEACAEELADALDDVWAIPDKLLGQTL